MNWLKSIDKIYLVNLLHRQDRLLKSAELLEEYHIPYERFQAIHDKEQGARGLRDTMIKIFSEIIENNYKNTLIFEDDVSFCLDSFWFHDTMNKVVEQLPENYHLCYLGGQATGRLSHFHSANLIPVIKYFATHSVLYSLHGVKEIMARDFGYPIDNWIVESIQPMAHCYCTYPLLCSQRPDISDIGGQFIDWTPFIQGRFQQRVLEIGKR